MTAGAWREGLSIIIVAYNSWSLVRDLLAGLHGDKAFPANWELLVVDSGSTIEATLDERSFVESAARVIRTGNRGFGAANNAGEREASFDTLFFLNPDTIAGVQVVRDLYDRFTSLGRGLILGPSLVLTDGRYQASAFPFPGLAGDIASASGIGRIRAHGGSRLARGRERECGFVSGAAFMIGRSDFRSLGGFDESFFLYHEETDLAKRAAESGIHSRYFPTQPILHLGGAVIRQSESSIWHSYRSTTMYRSKHYSRGARAISWIVMKAEIALKIPALLALYAIGAERAFARARTYLKILRASRRELCG